MYDSAGPAEGFDRYIILETGVIYTGGLMIGASYNLVTTAFEGSGEDVKILGNGAILDLQGEQIAIYYCTNHLVIEDCVIVNGNVRFKGSDDDILQALPTGHIQNVTFYQPHDYGVRLQNCGIGISINHNIFMDAVNTGDDFIPLSGYPNSWLPTGISVATSGQWMNAADISDNWSYFSDPYENGDLLKHFAFL